MLGRRCTRAALCKPAGTWATDVQVHTWSRLVLGVEAVAAIVTAGTPA